MATCIPISARYRPVYLGVRRDHWRGVSEETTTGVNRLYFLKVTLAELSMMRTGTGVFAVFDLLAKRRRREFGVHLELGALALMLRRVVLADALTTAIRLPRWGNR